MFMQTEQHENYSNKETSFAPTYESVFQRETLEDLSVSQASLCHHETRPRGNVFLHVVSARTLA